MSDPRPALHARIRALLERLAQGARDEPARDALLLELARYQTHAVAPYARYAGARYAARGLDPRAVDTLADVAEVPALPTDAFRHARISSRSEAEDVQVFVSSGTTQEARSRHPFQDLSLYDAAAYAAARYALFPDRERMALVILAPHERELPDSSLSYMLARFLEWFGDDASTHVWPLAGVELERLAQRLERAQEAALPLALLGTSFAFVHAIDALGGRRFALPPESRVMQTGGFKGRARELSPVAMCDLLSATFGVADDFIVAEYGMTELSSQLYELRLRKALLGEPSGPRRLWAPGWVRVSAVDPDTLAPLPCGQAGLIRIDDCANLDSVAFVQTGDLGVCHEDGLELHGRAPAAVARGCSITADELLARAT